ncbi:MAG: hypothetical protein GTN82_02200 [Candidatus Aminicenantes bacterium]|nr:hypothetical protein [Candidatus Aminicenantes bacterium]
MALREAPAEINIDDWNNEVKQLGMGDASSPGLNEVRMFQENGIYKLKVYDGTSWKETNRSYTSTIISEITSGVAINFDDGHSLITVHDGSGNFNLKSGVDENKTITNGDGGSHIRLDHTGMMKFAVSTQTEGNTFTDDQYILIDSNGVVINGNTVFHAGNLEIESGTAAGSTSGQQNSFATAFSQTPVVLVTPKSSNSGVCYVISVTTTAFTLVTPTSNKFCYYIAIAGV